jgi:hypothetical protein
MARAVLIAACAMALALLSVIAPGTGLAGDATWQPCSSKMNPGISGTTQADFQNLWQRSQTVPFYTELVHKLGKPLSCTAQFSNGNIAVSYEFRENGRVISRINPILELSEERLDFRVPKARALALLKETEKDLYGQSGCGVSWSRPVRKPSAERRGSREIVYRGDTCNCQAREIYDDDAIVALVLKSAC